MELRAIKQEDCTAVLALFQQVHDLHVQKRPDVYRPSPQAMDETYFHTLLESGEAILLGTEEGGQLVGFLHMTLKQTPDNRLVVPRTILYLEELVVDEAHRGKGIATALFAEVKKIAKEKGARDIELMVWSFNQDAIAFYEKMGMKIKHMRMEMNIE